MALQMGTDLFEQTIRLVLESRQISMGDNLLGFRMDADHAVEADGVFTDAVLTDTGDPQSRLHIDARLAEDVGTLGRVRDGLLTAWHQLMYSEFQATRLQIRDSAAVLDFVTASGAELCVTGRIRIYGEHYERLRRKER